MTYKKVPISVSHALYLRNCRSYHIDIIEILGTQWYLQVFFFIFLKKCSIVNIKIILFFSGPLQQFFLINSCFSTTLINAKKKFWGVPPPSSHVCDFFCHFLWQMPVYLVGCAKCMLYSEQPTVLLARRHLNTMLLTNFENLDSISNIFQETHNWIQ